MTKTGWRGCVAAEAAVMLAPAARRMATRPRTSAARVRALVSTAVERKGTVDRMDSLSGVVAVRWWRGCGGGPGGARVGCEAPGIALRSIRRAEAPAGGPARAKRLASTIAGRSSPSQPTYTA